MARLTFCCEDMLPRMRAFIVRAGLSSLVSSLDSETLAAARSVYIECPDAVRPSVWACDVRSVDFPAPIPPEIDGCASYTLMAFTLGGQLDRLIDERFARGEAMRGTLTDAWGSEAVEALAVSVDSRLRAERGEGTMRFAPGYSGYDIRHNARWLERILEGESGAEISVSPETGLITPRKSIICAIGWRGWEVGG